MTGPNCPGICPLFSARSGAVKRSLVWSCLLLWLGMSPALQALEVRAEGLLKGAAILIINDRRQLLKEGEGSPEGVVLVSANPKQAVIEYQGQRQTLTLSRRISSVFQQREQALEVTIHRNDNRQYLTEAFINGHLLTVIVDTGANSVVISAEAARRMGIAYQTGAPAKANTAGGERDAWIIQLDSVSVGGIVARHIQAVVIEGSHPANGLLGMSFLEHVDMRESGGVLHLRARH